MPNRASSSHIKAIACALLLLLAHGARLVRAQTGSPPESRNAPAAAASKETGAAKGSLKGRVVGEGGEPFSGAVVFLIGTAPSTGPRMRTATVTDDDGSFTFNDLAPGIYRVSVNQHGYVANYDEQGKRLSQNYRPNDFATIRMFKGGVITGTVTDASGEPVVAIGVRAHRIRDLDGQSLTSEPGAGLLIAPDAQTDDRGVYRIYGLPPGVYVVAADDGATRLWGGPISAFKGEVPTFHPSSTRDTAAEVIVRAGQEATGIDVRYRGEPGHRVTGTVATQGAEAGRDTNTLIVSLSDAATGMQMAGAIAERGASTRSFSFEGVADGDYNVRAVRIDSGGRLSVSQSQRISVRGADATGLKLTLAPMAAISGSVVIERLKADAAPETCGRIGAPPHPQETIISARREDGASATTLTRLRAEAVPDESGAFTIVNLEAGRYHIEADPPDERLYLSAIQLPSAPAARPGAARGATGTRAASGVASTTALSIRDGQRMTGVKVRFDEGAAHLRGRVLPADESIPLPSPAHMRLYLVPVERERADDPLRYAEATPSADHAFVFLNLAPGRYHLVARDFAKPPVASARAPFHEADGRASLRREAEASGIALDLQPCQRLTGFALRLPRATTR